MLNVALINTKKRHFALITTELISFLSLVQSVVLLNEEKTANYRFSLKHAQYLPAEKKTPKNLSFLSHLKILQVYKLVMGVIFFPNPSFLQQTTK